MIDNKKEIDLFSMLKESFVDIWKNKVLWLLGSIFVLFGGGFSYTSGNNYVSYISRSYVNSRDSEDVRFFESSSEKVLGNFTEKTQNFVKSDIFVPFLLICGCLLIIGVIVGIYVRITTKNMIVVYSADMNTKISLKELFLKGQSKLFKIFLLNILSSLVGSIISIVSLPLICFCGLGILTSFAGGILLEWIYHLMYRNIIIDDDDLVDAFNNAYAMITGNIKTFLLYLLFSIAIGILNMIVLVIFSILPLIVIVLLFVANQLIFAIPLALLTVLLLVVVEGPIVSAVEVFRTKFWLALK